MACRLTGDWPEAGFWEISPHCRLAFTDLRNRSTLRRYSRRIVVSAVHDKVPGRRLLARLAFVVRISGVPVIQTESFTDRESSIKAAVGCFFQTDSRAIKDIIMRKKLLTQLLWLTSLLVVKDLPYQRVKDVPLPQ